MKAKPKGAKGATKRKKPEPRDEFEKLKIELRELARAVYDDRISAKDRRRRASEIRKGIKDLRKRLAQGEVKA